MVLFGQCCLCGQWYIKEYKLGTAKDEKWNNKWHDSQTQGTMREEGHCWSIRKLSALLTFKSSGKKWIKRVQRHGHGNWKEQTRLIELKEDENEIVKWIALNFMLFRRYLKKFQGFHPFPSLPLHSTLLFANK